MNLLSAIRGYSAILLATSSFVVMVVASINYIGDPYGIQPFSENNIEDKSEIALHIGLHKDLRVTRLKLRSAVIGNSMVEFGIDPFHPLLPQPSFNYGVSGASYADIEKRFRILRDLPDLEKVVWVIEIAPYPHLKDYLVLPEKSWLEMILSIDTIYSFVQSMISPSSKIRYHPSGYRLQTLESCSQGDQYASFQTESKSTSTIGEDDSYGRNVIEKLRTTLTNISAMLREKDVKLIIVIPRYHQIMSESFTRRYIDEIHNVVDGITKTNSLVTFVDASRIGDESFDRVDYEKRDASEWYWDSHHFKVSLGDLILNHAMSEPGIRP
jgi:hypothetical protein